MAFTSLVVKQTYSGDNSTTTFAIPFHVVNDAEDETLVYIRDTNVDPVTETLQTISTDYSISGSNVVFVTAPATGEKIILARSLPLTQTLDLITSGAFLPESHEITLDKIVALLQQLDEKIARAPVMQITEQIASQITLEEPSYGTYLGWNAAEDGIQNFTADEIATLQTLGNELTTLTLLNQASSPSSPASGKTFFYIKTDGFLRIKNSSGTEKIIDPLMQPTGTYAAPSSIVAGTGITYTAEIARQILFVKGSGGAVTVSASPPITAGILVGQELLIIGCDDTNTVTLSGSSSGISLNGDIVLADKSSLGLVWSGTSWIETFRNGI